MTGRVFAQTCDALQSSPGDEHPVLGILRIRLEKKDGARGNGKVAHLELVSILVNLLLAGPNGHVQGRLNEL